MLAESWQSHKKKIRKMFAEIIQEDQATQGLLKSQIY